MWDERDGERKTNGDPVRKVVRELAEVIGVNGTYSNEMIWGSKGGCERVVDGGIVVFSPLSGVIVRKFGIKIEVLV